MKKEKDKKGKDSKVKKEKKEAPKTPKKEVKKENPKKESTKKSTYRITYSKIEKVWNVKLDGAERVSRKFDNKEEALSWAEQASQTRNTNLIVHKRDGKFQRKKY